MLSTQAFPWFKLQQIRRLWPLVITMHLLPDPTIRELCPVMPRACQDVMEEGLEDPRCGHCTAEGQEDTVRRRGGWQAVLSHHWESM